MKKNLLIQVSITYGLKESKQLKCVLTAKD